MGGLIELYREVRKKIERFPVGRVTKTAAIEETSFAYDRVRALDLLKCPLFFPLSASAVTRAKTNKLRSGKRTKEVCEKPISSFCKYLVSYPQSKEL